MKTGNPSFRSTRLLDQVRERIRYLHYSLQTEKAYLYWVRFFIRWHGRGGVMRHPRDMGAADLEAFLNMLANERQVSPSTHNQALSALLFLYREVLAIDLPWLNGLNRPPQKKRIPSVLTRDEVGALFSFFTTRWLCWPSCSMAPACASWKGCACVSRMWTSTAGSSWCVTARGARTAW
jgi:integrase